MTEQQKPSVSRMVHYVSYGTPGGEYGRECRAAIITEVAADDPATVGLAVLNPTGLFFASCRQDEGSLQRLSINGAPPTLPYPGGTWHWPERV